METDLRVVNVDMDQEEVAFCSGNGTWYPLRSSMASGAWSSHYGR